MADATIVRYPPKQDADGDGIPDNNIITVDETNKRVGINDTAPAVELEVVDATASSEIRATADTDNTTNQAAVGARVGATTYASVIGYGANFTTSGKSKASGGSVQALGAGGLSVVAGGAAGDLRFYTGGTADANERMTIDQDGLTTLNGAYVQQGGELGLYVYKGLVASGLTTSWGYLWEDFNANPTDNAAPPTWSHFPAAGTAAVTNWLAGTTGGVSRMKTGATAGSRMDQLTNVFLTHQAGTARWYYACRMKLPTTTDALTLSAQGLQAGTNYVAVGYNGRLTGGDGRFVAYYDGNFTTTGTVLDLAAVDTSWHVFEMWVAGDAILRARIDGGTTVVAGGAQASGAADAYIYHVAGNGTTAADKHMDRDWCLCLYGRA